MVGHCSIAVTDRYAHSTDEARHAAAQRAAVELPDAEVPDAEVPDVEVPGVEVVKGTGTNSGTRPIPQIQIPARFRVPRDGVEPPTRGFSVPCSTT
jgi:hypothetical protein